MRPSSLVLATLLPAVALAAPTLVLNHSGRLLDDKDAPVTSAVTLKFELHASAIVNAQDQIVWSDTFANVPVDSHGVYSVSLGDTSAASGTGHVALAGTLFADDRWLAITVNGETLQPWLRVGAVPYAVSAGSVAGFTASDKATARELLALDTNGQFPASVLPAATASADGVLAHSDWAAFNGKLAHVATGAGLSGDGTAGSPLVVSQIGVTADAPLTGAGTAASHLGLSLAVGAGLSGNGTAGSPLVVSQIGVTADAPLTGAGTAASHLGLSLAVGTGLAGDGAANALAVQFAGSGSAGTAARSDHTHSNLQVAGSAVTAPTVTLSPSAAPACGAQGTAGGIYFDSTSKRFFGCDGNGWSQLLTANAVDTLVLTTRSSPPPGTPSLGQLYADSAGGLLAWSGNAWLPVALTYGTQSSPATTCNDLKTKLPTATTGVYWITGGGSAPYQAYCNMDFDNGGWTAFFSGFNGQANVFDHFESTSLDCPDPTTRCLRRAPSLVGTATPLAAQCGSAVLKFTAPAAVLAFLQNGTQAAWQNLANLTAVAGGASTAAGSQMWTGSGSNYSWIISGSVTSATFASSYSANTGWDFCNGASNNSSPIHLYYK